MDVWNYLFNIDFHGMGLYQGQNTGLSIYRVGSRHWTLPFLAVPLVDQALGSGTFKFGLIEIGL
jgi:hypothetical protein